jgi:hypothetical protein
MAKKHQQVSNDTHLGSIFVKEENTFVHSYELHHSDTYDTTSIRYAEGKLWSDNVQGSTAGFICDSGDIVTINVGSSTIQLDYAEMEVLTALIMACNDSEMEFRQYVVSSSLKPIK